MAEEVMRSFSHDSCTPNHLQGLLPRWRQAGLQPYMASFPFGDVRNLRDSLGAICVSPPTPPLVPY